MNDEPSSAGATGLAVRDAERRIDWPPVGSAFAASVAVHAIVIAGFAAVLARTPAAAMPNVVLPPIQAVIVEERRPEPSPPVAIRTAQAASPAPAVRPPPPQPAVRAPAPWTWDPKSVDLPPSFYAAPVLAEGVAFFETRNLAMLGEQIERRINAEYPNEARYGVTLKSSDALGYPIDVLAKGIEGRVFVWFGVDDEGKVVEREALDGPPELIEWVLPRLDRLVDEPAHDANGTAQRGWVALEINFSREAAEDARAMREAAEVRARRDDELAKARDAAK